MSTSTNQPQSVACVKIKAGHAGYENITIPSTHPIFRNQALPITKACGYPLVMARLTENLPRGPATDNQHATWFNIDPQSGFAPMQWQGGIGAVIVASADGKPLSANVLGAYLDYVSGILDYFEEGPPTHKYNRAALDSYIEGHLRETY